MKIKPKDILVPTVTLFVICVIVAVLLAGTNALTRDAVEKNQSEKAREAMFGVCPEAASFEAVEGQEAEVYSALDKAGHRIGYAVSVSAKGYGGEISVMVGISTPKKASAAITGVEILSHEETPGLGANAEKQDFRDQYKQEVPPEGFTVTKDGTGLSNGKIDAVTGATITSSAVTEAVNEAVKICEALEGGEP